MPSRSCTTWTPASSGVSVQIQEFGRRCPPAVWRRILLVGLFIVISSRKWWSVGLFFRVFLTQIISEAPSPLSNSEREIKILQILTNSVTWGYWRSCSISIKVKQWRSMGRLSGCRPMMMVPGWHEERMGSLIINGISNMAKLLRPVQFCIKRLSGEAWKSIVDAMSMMIVMLRWLMILGTWMGILPWAPWGGTLLVGLKSEQPGSWHYYRCFFWMSLR